MNYVKVLLKLKLFFPFLGADLGVAVESVETRKVEIEEGPDRVHEIEGIGIEGNDGGLVVGQRIARGEGPERGQENAEGVQGEAHPDSGVGQDTGESHHHLKRSIHLMST